MTAQAAGTLMFLTAMQVVAAVLLAGQYRLWRMESEMARPEPGWCPDCDAIDADLARLDEMLAAGRIHEARAELGRLRDVLDGVDEAAAADARWARWVTETRTREARAA